MEPCQLLPRVQQIMTFCSALFHCIDKINTAMPSHSTKHFKLTRSCQSLSTMLDGKTLGRGLSHILYIQGIQFDIFYLTSESTSNLIILG